MAFTDSSIGIGFTLNARYERAACRIFVIISDGESQEGSVWEAALCAGKHHLSNLTVLMDYNKQQSYSAPPSRCRTWNPLQRNGESSASP